MSNFGSCPTIESNEGTRIGLVRFDVSSLAGQFTGIESVTLRLFSQNAPATGGTADAIEAAGLTVRRVKKVTAGRPNIVDMILNDEADFIVNTTEGRKSIEDSAPIRAGAESHRVSYTTTLTAAEAICLAMKDGDDPKVRRLQDLHGEIS